MTPTPASPAKDVLAEDRLLWEFWINHGLEAAPLELRLLELPPGANAPYMAMNALYGGFEERLLQALDQAAARGWGGAASAAREVATIVRAPAARVGWDLPEGELLTILSLWPGPGSALAARAADAAARITSWPAFVRSAGRCNLVGAVAAGFAACGLDDAVPDPWRGLIGSAAEGIRLRALRILPLVTEVASALSARGIPCCLLKESALIGEIYPEPGQRPMGDVDILVAEEHLGPVAETLADRGHRPFEGIWSAEWYRSHHHHAAPLVSAEAASKVEPHLGIWIPGGGNHAVAREIMERARPHRTIAALRPEPTFMAFHLLCDLHGGASLGKLGQAADLMRFLAAEGREVEGERLVDLAKRTGSLTYVEDSIRLIASVHGRELLDERAPALSGLGLGSPGSLARRLRERLERKNLYGFEPRASALSVASVKLVHKSLMQPGGTGAAAGAFAGSLLRGGSAAEEGAGPIARKGRGSATGRLLRLAGFPFRAAWRALRRAGR